MNWCQKIPDKKEVKDSIWSLPYTAPGSDGLTSLLYKQCWETLGDVLRRWYKQFTQYLREYHSWSLGLNPKKNNSIIPSDKRRISVLNADFKALTGVDANCLQKDSTHTLSSCQHAAGDDRRIQNCRPPGHGRSPAYFFLQSYITSEWGQTQRKSQKHYWSETFFCELLLHLKNWLQVCLYQPEIRWF